MSQLETLTTRARVLDSKLAGYVFALKYTAGMCKTSFFSPQRGKGNQDSSLGRQNCEKTQAKKKMGICPVFKKR